MKGRLNVWLLLIAVVCAASWWFGRDLLQPAPAELEPVAQSRVKESPTSEAVHLEVLNGTARAGLARDFGLLLGQAGCVVERVGNAPHDHFQQTVLVNRQLSAGRARALAAELGGVAVVQEFDRRTAADAVLVLGRDADQVRQALADRIAAKAH